MFSAVGMLEPGKNETYKYFLLLSKHFRVLEPELWVVGNQLSGTAGNLMNVGITTLYATMYTDN